MAGENATEVLWAQLPVYFRPVMEFQEILKAHGRGLHQAEKEIGCIRDNLYMASCDGQTLSYYENLMGLSGDNALGLSLEERRSLVLAQYAMRPLYTFLALKEMLSCAVGADGYRAECLYDSYRLIVKVMEQDIKKVKELYNMIALIRPAHITIMVYAEYRGEVSIPIKQAAAITFTSAFYPRLNIPKLFLNGMWKLDKSQKLSGYDGYGRLDFYPVAVKFQANIRGMPQEKLLYRVVAGAGEKLQTAEAVSVKVQAECKAADKVRMRIQVPVEAKAETGDIRMYNRNRLDGVWKMDGRRKLNGGVSVL